MSKRTRQVALANRILEVMREYQPDSMTPDEVYVAGGFRWWHDVSGAMHELLLGGWLDQRFEAGYYPRRSSFTLTRRGKTMNVSEDT